MGRSATAVLCLVGGGVAALLFSVATSLAQVPPPSPYPSAEGGLPLSGGTLSGTCTNDPNALLLCVDSDGIAQGQSDSTTDPVGFGLRPGACAPSDATCTAANLNLFGGQDTTTIAIDGADPSVSCAGDNDTVTVTVYDRASGGTTATVLTEGTEWTASASVSDTCDSLAAAVGALTGVGATCASPSVLVTLDIGTGAVTLAESTAGCTTVSTGSPGSVVLGREGGPTFPSLAWAVDLNSGFYRISSDRIGMTLGGTLVWDAHTSRHTFRIDIDLRDNELESATEDEMLFGSPFAFVADTEQSSDPCGTFAARTVYYSSADFLCFCTPGGVDLKMDGSTACSY